MLGDPVGTVEAYAIYGIPHREVFEVAFARALNSMYRVNLKPIGAYGPDELIMLGPEGVQHASGRWVFRASLMAQPDSKSFNEFIRLYYGVDITTEMSMPGLKMRANAPTVTEMLEWNIA